MGFNELFKYLKKMDVKMSKSTLSEHLRHLTKKKLLKKKKIGKQRVSYELNLQEFEQLLGAKELAKKMMNRLEDIQKGEPIPFENLFVLAKFTLQYVIMQQLRLKILSILNPKKTFHYNLENLIITIYFQGFSNLILEECKKKPELGEQLLQKLESEIKGYWNFIPDHTDI